MSDHDSRDASPEEIELPSVEIGTLKRILHQSAPTPQSHFHRRLREPGGAQWFDETTRATIAELGGSGPLFDNRSDAVLLASLKRRGKSHLKAARSTEEIESAALLYFAGVLCLLAHPETSSVSEVTGLDPAVVEDSIQVISEVLDEDWRPVIESALRFYT